MQQMGSSSRGKIACVALLGLALSSAAGLTGGALAATPQLPENMGADPAGSSDSPTSRTTTRSGAQISESRGGGITIPLNPRIEDAYCVKQCVSTRRATPGAVVRLTGENFGYIKAVVFPGKNGNMRVRWHARSTTAVRVVVPRGADDGRPFVIDAAGTKSNRAPREIKIVPKSLIPIEVFPVRGPYSFGGSGGRFGAGRPGHIHQGQDLSASCGTRLVSIKRAKVAYSEYHSAAGNYVVLKNRGENTYFAYMHLIRPSSLNVGDRVAAGQPIGRVGNTGRSSGCHLHFEYWVGPWQTGGKPIDPLPYLRSL